MNWLEGLGEYAEWGVSRTLSVAAKAVTASLVVADRVLAAIPSLPVPFSLVGTTPLDVPPETEKPPEEGWVDWAVRNVKQAGAAIAVKAIDQVLNQPVAPDSDAASTTQNLPVEAAAPLEQIAAPVAQPPEAPSQKRRNKQRKARQPPLAIQRPKEPSFKEKITNILYALLGLFLWVFAK